MRLSRSIIAAAISALTLSAAVDTARAQANVCTSLEAELASLENGATAGSAAEARQYDASIAKQRNEIDRARAEAGRAGCLGGFLIFQPRPQAKCGALMATIDRMEANLRRLQASRSRYASSSSEVARRRAEVLSALAYNRCGTGYNAGRGGGGFNTASSPRESESNFFDMLFGGRIRTQTDRYYNGQFGTYRTLCVRTCDGYYFPISFSTVPSKFAADEQTCQAMCPGSDVRLYTYRNPGEEPNQMVSLAGEPYTVLPTAFRYRKEYDAACACRAPDPTLVASLAPPATLRPVMPAAGGLTTGTPVPIPVLRASMGEDPETLANRTGDFIPRQIRGNQGGDTVAGVSPDGERSVRVVGPSYYYGQ